MKFFTLTIFISLFLFTSCSKNESGAPAVYTFEKVKSEESQVLFIRYAKAARAINPSIYEVTSGEPVLLGILYNECKIVHNTTPGKHIYMVVSESADFIEANLTKGKTYYSIVTPRMGIWKARFSIYPIRNNNTTNFNTSSKNFDNWVNKTKVISLNKTSEEWYQKHQASIKEKQNSYWEVWSKKPEVQKKEQTLNPEDGN